MSLEEPPVGDEDNELAVVLEDLAEHRETLHYLLETADQLERSGMLDLFQVVATQDRRGTEQIFETFAENPTDLQAVQNATLLARALSRIDPDVLAAGIEGIEEGRGLSKAELSEPPQIGLVGAMRKLRDPDVRRGIGMLFMFLKTLGSRSESR